MAKKRVNRKRTQARTAKKDTPASKPGKPAKPAERIHPFVKDQALAYAEDKGRRVQQNIRVILLLALIGIMVSLFMLWLHYKPPGSSICSFSRIFDCELVNKSSYSAVLGIPLAFLALMWYALFTSVSLVFLRTEKPLDQRLRMRRLSILLLWSAIVGFLVSAYLVAVQAFILNAWCIFCLTSDVLVTLILALSIMNIYHCESCKERIRQLGLDPEKMCKSC